MNMKSWRFRSLVGASAVGVTAAVAFGATGIGSAVFAAGREARAGVGGDTKSNERPCYATTLDRGDKEKLLATYVESSGLSLSGTSIPPGTPTALDPVNQLKCPTGETCTITDTISVQLYSTSSDTENDFATLWQLDGSYAGEEGPLLRFEPDRRLR